MMNEELNAPTYRQSLKEEMKQVAATEVVAPSYQRKKLLLWFIRNAITALLCWYFWEKDWIRWVLWIGIPLAMLNVVMIVLGPYLLRRKMKLVEKQINSMP